MNNRLILAIIGLLLIGPVFISCTRPQLKNPSTSQQLQVYLTDHPALGFDSLWLDLRGLEIRDSEGWKQLPFSAGLYNITALRNGRDSLLVADSLLFSDIQKLRLILGTGNFLEKDGRRIPLQLQESDAAIEIEIGPQHYDRIDRGLRFWIDINVAASVKVDNSGSGNHNGYRLKLEMACFGDHASGRIKGEVQPAAALPWLELIADNVVMGIPEADGRFEWRGLPPSVYSLHVHATNGYADTILTGLIVSPNTEIRLPEIILHR